MQTMHGWIILRRIQKHHCDAQSTRCFIVFYYQKVRSTRNIKLSVQCKTSPNARNTTITNTTLGLAYAKISTRNLFIHKQPSTCAKLPRLREKSKPKQDRTIRTRTFDKHGKDTSPNTAIRKRKFYDEENVKTITMPNPQLQLRKYRAKRLPRSRRKNRDRR